MVDQSFEHACDMLKHQVDSGTIEAAVLCVGHGDTTLLRGFGLASDPASRFLIASISKPMTVAAFMVLVDHGDVVLDQKVSHYLPEFQRGRQSNVTVRHLLTHVSGLPDQLPDNAELRSRKASLEAFIEGALLIEPQFEPGTRFQYSSMAILLAAEIVQRITKIRFAHWTQQVLFEPLDMTSSSMGLKESDVQPVVRTQIEFAAREAGGGDPAAKEWDWNSRYWRTLGAPWGGVISTAEDVAQFLKSFLKPMGKVLRSETALEMVRNHNPKGIMPRGLGFQVRMGFGFQQTNVEQSERRDVFGHTGSTGTLAWADPESERICVVLTSLPVRSGIPHVRDRVSEVIFKQQSN